ncbi:carbonic anhydrase/acetyltransferase-like protein (isoleucine patch superfamily) [Paraburkholderia sp. WSM4177]|nr:carbonic anhydrase/acetyltransferase-like protein (isoleucine patch superfamily) [Paraburkholderia sp. WSM4177]MBB5483103.1 carbonic anhydrase/acetyltransferase-like protein (isoleucine patch superfamily) [Paraburkholderia sp. WSM4180]
MREGVEQHRAALRRLHAASTELARFDQVGPFGAARQASGLGEIEAGVTERATVEYRSVQLAGRRGLRARIPLTQRRECGAARARRLVVRIRCGRSDRNGRSGGRHDKRIGDGSGKDGGQTAAEPRASGSSTQPFTILDSTIRRALSGTPVSWRRKTAGFAPRRVHAALPVRGNRSDHHRAQNRSHRRPGSDQQGDVVTIYKLGEAAPIIHESVFVADSANIIGNVTLEENASVWFGATLRGDNEPITIGAGSNVQESAVLHTDPGYPLTVESNVTIGHQAMLHGCTIKEGALIGIQAVVLNGAVIGRNCLVGAGAIVTEGKVFPDNTLILGAPAKAVRELTEADIANMQRGAASYAGRREYFKAQLVRIG